jgi:hypothetical protein
MPEVPRSTAATRSQGVAAPAPTRYAIVGTGWRAGIDIARARSDLFEMARPEVQETP